MLTPRWTSVAEMIAHYRQAGVIGGRPAAPADDELVPSRGLRRELGPVGRDQDADPADRGGGW
ncbi:hypothetical protein ACFYS8_36315 [Kitasatospora sp. NPDC004615]|uniref:hypothetical protein n=1 Tax=Kitasatospora sp. NPDC004615 TaxID=3364017 RepID=UPI00368CE938